MAGSVREAVDIGPGRIVRHATKTEDAAPPSVDSGTRAQTVLKQTNPANRIEFIYHNHKQVLLVDCSSTSARETEDIARSIPDYVTTRQRNSVLVLADFSQTRFDRETIRTMKETAVFNKGYVKKSAWIGSASFLWDIKQELEHFSHRKFSIFASKADALRWLTAD